MAALTKDGARATATAPANDADALRRSLSRLVTAPLSLRARLAPQRASKRASGLPPTGL